MKEKKQLVKNDKKNFEDVAIMKARAMEMLMEIQTPSVVKRCLNYITYIYLHND